MYMDYELNKGIGESAEFKGLKAQYLFIFAGGLLGYFDQIIGGDMVERPMALHRFRCNLRIRTGLADIPPERQVRRTRTDEAAGQKTAPPLPDQPDQSPKIIHD